MIEICDSRTGIGNARAHIVPVVRQAVLPKSIALGSGDAYGVCHGDGCNSNMGDCPSDGSCGQDCSCGSDT